MGSNSGVWLRSDWKTIVRLIADSKGARAQDCTRIINFKLGEKKNWQELDLMEATIRRLLFQTSMLVPASRGCVCLDLYIITGSFISTF